MYTTDRLEMAMVAQKGVWHMLKREGYGYATMVNELGEEKRRFVYDRSAEGWLSNKNDPCSPSSFTIVAHP